MSSVEATEAVANFVTLFSAFKAARLVESQKLAEKLAADGELGVAVAESTLADANSEDALRVMLAALAEVGVNP